MKYTAESALLELQQAEITLDALYDVAFDAAKIGALSEDHRRQVHVVRDYVQGIEKILYDFVTGVIRGAAGRLGKSVADRLIEEIPEPKSWPDAPPPTAGMSPAEAHETAMAAKPTKTDGLGYVQAGFIWAAAVIGVVAVAAGAYALIKTAEVVQSIVVDIVKARENTKRYAKELSEQKRRYQKCVDSGKSPEHCAGLFPTPEAPQEETSSEGGPRWWLIALSAVGAVAVVAGGVWVYDRYFTKDDFGFEAARKKSRPKPLSPGEINSALSGYQLEVE